MVLQDRSIRVLVVDDSAVVRMVVKKILEEIPAISTVDTASNGNTALRKIKSFNPHVITLDVEMPGMDGLTLLGHVMKQFPRPVIMLSAFTFRGAKKTIEALELGAVDFIQKSACDIGADRSALEQELLEKVVAVAASFSERDSQLHDGFDFSMTPASDVLPKQKPEVIAIGASTGGTEAVRLLLTNLPKDFEAGIVITQHMPAGFTKAYADHLNNQCAIEVKEASPKDTVRPGRALIAPGHSHMMLAHGSYGYYVNLNRHNPVNGHRPSVDVLFHSVAKAGGGNALGILLTGMGQDGAVGMGSILDAGGFTIAQDKQSCVVFGMPKAAIEMEVVSRIAPLSHIPAILKRAQNPASETKGQNEGSTNA